jgi:thioredoxin reductase (NADPH)
VPGLYAAGDVTDAHFKQAIIGAAEGVYASVQAFEYLQNLKA